MLLNITKLYGMTLAASDCDIGKVRDFYFDDKHWTIRYLVADTGEWLKGRLVLISPYAFGEFDAEGRSLSINLTRRQIETCPGIDSHLPVSRQYEVDYTRHYGWPTYWDGGGVWGVSGFPSIEPMPEVDTEPRQKHQQGDGKHLRSVRAITGYHIQTIDGAIGHVTGILVDDRSWAIRELIVEAGAWYSGKEILISHAKIDRISYEESAVHVRLTKADIERTAEHELARPH
jgi:hypothetical protein